MSAASRRVLSVFLITLFALYYVNITLFPHTHHVGGVVIVHSHFYSGTTASGEPDHMHTRSRLIIISDLSLFLTTAILIGYFGFRRRPAIPYQYVSLIVRCADLFSVNNFQPRAPPVMS